MIRRANPNGRDTKTNNLVPQKLNVVENPLTGKVSAPMFPGQTMGINMNQARSMYQNAVRSKGFTFSGGTTMQTEPIDIPGDARLLLGIATLNGSWGTATLKVNQTDVIEDSDTGFLQMGDNKDFYRLELPLTGNDTIKMLNTGYAAYTNEPVIFFFI